MQVKLITLSIPFLCMKMFEKSVRKASYLNSGDFWNSDNVMVLFFYFFTCLIACGLG